MNLFKGLLVSAALLVGFSAGAATPTLFDVVTAVQQKAMSDVDALAFNWKVGDTNNYNINAGFIKGTMVMSVKQEVAEGFWLDQNLDLGFLGKQESQVLIDKNTGQILKMIVNGKEQTPPDSSDIELIDTKEDHITVPAGAFDCIHIRAKNKKDNTELNQWVNPQLIPISGMLKSVSPSQMGEVTVELTSFKKN